MRRDDLLRRVQEKPFRPFYLRLSGGDVHFVRHPETVWVTASSVLIGIPRTDQAGPNDIGDYAAGPLSDVEPIDPRPVADGNGD